MALLTGRTEDGQEVPVQVKPDGRLVAEGLTGPTGAQGPAGPQGPQGVPSYPGVILQVVTGYFDVLVEITSQNWTFTGLEAAITPASSNSSILVMAAQAGCYKYGSDNGLELKLDRDSTQIRTFESQAGYTGDAEINTIGTCSFTWLDRPNTTSQIIYRTMFRNIKAAGAVGVQARHGQVSSTSTITLMEVAG